MALSYPIYNSKDLLSHCRFKESNVRKKALPTIHSEFRIYIKTEDDYIPERQMFVKTGGFKVQPSGEEPPPEELEKLFVSGNKIVLNIKAKLEKLEFPSAKRAELIRELVTGYVVGQNEIETLNQKFPSIYSSVVQLKSATESQLAIRTLCNTNNHGTVLQEILMEYEKKLSSDFSGSLSSALITRLSTEAISDWLGRCPLDFYSRGTIYSGLPEHMAQNFRLRLMLTIPPCSYFIVDDYCYVSLYSLRLSGGSGPCMIFKNSMEPNAYFAVLLQEFQLTWELASNDV
jgi:hypothetical protein